MVNYAGMNLQARLEVPKTLLILPVPLNYRAANDLRNNLAFFFRTMSFVSPWHVFGVSNVHLPTTVATNLTLVSMMVGNQLHP